MNKITINGRTTYVSGNNIEIKNGLVYVDGVIANTPQHKGVSGVVKIKFEGNLANIKCKSDVEVIGNVEGNIDCGGNVKCENVGGSIDAGGNINCERVDGDIDTEGKLTCKYIYRYLIGDSATIKKI